MASKKYEPRIPLAIQGGIRAQQLRGTQARSWWVKQWIDSVEAFGMGARTGRGKNYSIQGQVNDLILEPGCVSAKVQGAESKPYSVSISAPTITKRQREKFLSLFHNNPIFLARLLVQDLPKEVESAFISATGRSLFPGIKRRPTNAIDSEWDLRHNRGEPRTLFEMRCNCKDWARPCKHLAAICFLISELIATDPFKLLVLHGFSWNDLGIGEDYAPQSLPSNPSHTEPMNKLPADSALWWGNLYQRWQAYGPQPSRSGSVIPLMERIGAPSLWRGNEKFLEVMNKIYGCAKQKSLPLLDGIPVNFHLQSPTRSSPNTSDTRPPKRLRVMVY